MFRKTRENLAIARVREKPVNAVMKKFYAGLVKLAKLRKKLLSMKADYKNIKIMINKLLYKDQKEDFHTSSANCR